MNEPLDARIPLVSARSDDIESLRVRLAPPDAFERVGLDRPFHLSQLTFDVVTDDGPQPYIRVRTENPVREPFIAFLVEVRWSGGRLLREYTMLLDPPVHTPRETAPPPRMADPAPSVDRPADAPGTAPGRPATRDRVTEAPSGAREYGPVQRNETAWDVAMATRPDDSVTVHQMMMALVRANPNAFIDGNVNNLRAGAILRVPDRAEIQSMTAAESRREFARQVDEWRAGRSPAPATEPPAEETVAQQEDSGRLQVMAAGEADGDDATASLLDEDLEATSENLDRMRRELLASQEEAAELRSQNEELQRMATEMRQRVEALERMVDLDMQPGVTGTPADDPLAELPDLLEPEDPVAESTDQPAELPETDLLGLHEELAATLGDGQETATLTDDEAVAGSVDEPVAEDPAAADIQDEVAAAPEAQPAPAQPAAMDDFQRRQPAPWEDPRLLGRGAAVVLVLITLLLLLRRRRKAAAEAGAPLAAGGAVVEDDDPMDQAAAAAVAEAPEAQADPLEEAEAYMGYGRYDQAREVIEKGLVADAENKHLRLKLLEIHALNHDRAEFEAEAQVLYGQVDGSSDPVWQRAAEMGAEIAPENPLFAAADSGDAGSLLNETFDLDTYDEPEAPVRPAVQEQDDIGDMAFDGLDDEPETPRRSLVDQPEDDFSDLEAALEDESEPADELSDLEFSLDERGVEDSPRREEPAALTDDQDDDDFGLDFDLDSEQEPRREDAGEVAADDAALSEEEDDALSLDFDMDTGASDVPDDDLDVDKALEGLDLGAGDAGSDDAAALD
ncbi:MAG: hypothetical protein LAT50_11085, partial [Ectothiorhodospiraceae bacterium]|nr:hypothetical protein [Ectothiorhodospiraceae bacterium]